MKDSRYQEYHGKARGLSAAARSDVGRVRSANQDTFVCDLEKGVFAVIDGMGGAKAGEVAARLTREAVLESAGTNEDLQKPLARANQKIHLRSQKNPAEQGMGCVATVTRVDGPDLEIAHVGDTRAFLASAAGCEQLTRDHTVVADIQEKQGLTDRMAKQVPGQHQVTRDIGGRLYTDMEWVDKARTPFAVQDVLLLCSDGLTDMVGVEEIFQSLSRARRKREDLRDLVNRLIERALVSGGKDNVTVVAVRREKTQIEKQSWFSKPGSQLSKSGKKLTSSHRSAKSPALAEDSPPQFSSTSRDAEKVETATSMKRQGTSVLVRRVGLLLLAVLALAAGWILRPAWPWIAASLHGEGSPGVVRVLNSGADFVHGREAGIDGLLTRNGLVSAANPLRVEADQTRTEVAPDVEVTLHGLLLEFPDKPGDWKIQIGAGSQLVLRQISIRERLLKIEVVFEDEGGSLVLRDSHVEVARFQATGPVGSRLIITGGALRTQSNGGSPVLEGTELVRFLPPAEASDTSE